MPRLFLLCLWLMLGVPGLVTAQTPTDAASEVGAPVRFNGRVLFRVRERIGPFSPQERAAAVERRLTEVSGNPFSGDAPLHVTDYDTTTDVEVGETVILTVTDADAATNRTTRLALAQNRAEILRQALNENRRNYDPRTLAVGVGLTLLTTLIFFGLAIPAGRVVRRTIESYRLGRARPLRLKPIHHLDELTAGQFHHAVAGAIGVGWLAVRVALVGLYFPLVLSFFPSTRGISKTFWSYALKPLGTLWGLFLFYLPNLLFLLTIAVLTFYAVKLSRLFFQAVERGQLKFSGFDTEWAWPTHKITALFIIASALVVAFPYLPGSESPAFRGVTIFLGAIFSFASSSAISNIVSGVMLTYTGAFRLGDRVKIGSEIGDVTEKTLLVTRIRTIKNELISIPNTQVLSTSIVNYTALAKTDGLILNTTITIGYDAPWKRVHELLIAAARDTPDVLPEPAPFVLTTGLNDYNVSYQLNAFTRNPHRMIVIYGNLHENIQNRFNEGGVEIMSPAFTALRDGNHVTIPGDQVPENYTAPGFQVEIRKEP